MSEIIYLLTNPTIPDLVKIGRTANLQDRMRSLSAASGVAVPFECFYACTVADGAQVEKALHEAFGDHRINARREFFRISPARVQSVLKLLAVSEETPKAEIVEDQEELEALQREQTRRARFRFDLVGIQPGATLVFLKDETITAKVVDDRKIEFECEVTSTSNAARKILQRMGWNWTQVQGPAYWTFEGETLDERRMRLEGGDDESS